ncbi:LamG-like jellyroll fold domain-containing protein [Halorubrum sp. AJ67]|uniref:LamG-like jellyroll fold domain-containing protein n=1 Tax=Halorubrum sp. AJ67 TaxID=1173487 RepID=UPI0003DDBCF8|nr:LamG-like jellyroll fold domain-containing protein [Halorubrum sp. AJ67]CDK38125.1 concanavalin A-like lectin/glucanases family protein [Halorubrum sp. AJ67]
MVDESSRFTSDRRTREEASWAAQADWDAGTVENVDVTVSGLVADPPVQAGEVPDSGVGRWNFDSGGDVSVSIDSWNDNDATNHGATWSSDSAVGDFSTYYDGSSYQNHGIEIPSEIEFTLTSWFKADNLEGQQFINNLKGYGQPALRKASEEFGVQYHDSVDGWKNNVMTGTAGQWLFVAGAWNEAEGYCRVWFYDENGNRRTQDAIFNGFSNDKHAEGDIGASYSRAGIQFWEGHIDDPRVYFKELSSTEVDNLYNTGRIDG